MTGTDTIIETRIETVSGQHGRDAVLVKVQGPRVTTYKVRCRAASNSILGTLMDTRYAASSYLKAYNAAEAWAWRREVRGRGMSGVDCQDIETGLRIVDEPYPNGIRARAVYAHGYALRRVVRQLPQGLQRR